MVLDLMAQLDREFIERSKIETLLRELLDVKRNRKCEQLSADQLALFAATWQARQAEAVKPDDADDDDPHAAAAAGESDRKRTGGRQPLPRHLKRERIVHDLANEEKHCAVCRQDLRLIGEETSERYEYVPAQVTVIENICKKYACACTVKTRPSQRSRSRRARPEPACWRRSSWPKRRIICRYTDSSRSSNVTAWTSRARRWAAGWRNAPIC